MKIFGIAGWSGGGKTTLVCRLLSEFVGRGLRISTIKRAHHGFDLDKPGKDSYEHRKAGATEVMVTSGARWALMHELGGAPEATLEELIARMTPIDLLLVEGFKHYPIDKIEVYRAENGKPVLANDDPRVVAVASNTALDGLRVPILDLDDVVRIADFIVDHCRIEAA